MAFAFYAGDLTRGCVNKQLSILLGMRMMLGWSRGPVLEDAAAEDLDIKLAFQCRTEEVVPVCLVLNGYGAISARHTLVARYFGDINEDRWGSNVISGDVVWGRLSREGV